MSFRFKQFSVDDDQSTMKVGTDAVLLGAWADVANTKSILDVGTGCGVIALMLAQRATTARVNAVEIHRDSAIQAYQNFEASPWAGRLLVHNIDVRKLEAKFDLVVSNPPFFSNSLLPPTAERTMARHTTTLSYEDLLASGDRLLWPGGRLALIVPGKEIVDVAKRYGFECNRMTAVYPRQKVERWLLEFSRDKKIPVEDKLVLFDGDQRSAAYAELTREFYL